MAGLLVKQLVEAPRTCAYLPDRNASLEYRLMLDVEPDELDTMILRGWRRFGPIYFRPACAGCAQCVSIRLPADRFAPTAAQRRARRRCGRLHVTIGAPRLDEERLALHRAWHATREAARGWEPAALDAEGYFQQFAFPHPAGRELAFRDPAQGGRLVAVGLCDVTRRAMSAAYFFYDPSIARLSPGVANVLLCVELARAQGIPHVYLGYRVAGCPSMAYKAGFRPHELLDGLPAFDEEPVWR